MLKKLNLLLLIMCLTLSFSLMAKDKGKVINAKGTIIINGKSYDADKDMTTLKGLNLKVGDSVVAQGENSFCHIKLKNGSTFSVKDGEIKLEKLKKEKTIIGLIKGQIFSFVEKAKKSKKGPSYIVKTKYAAMGVRGTKFYVQEFENESYLCVCDGVVNLKNDKGNLDVNKFEDLHAKKDEELKKLKSDRNMWKIAKKGFADMGIDIGTMP